jgi:hypothetical protein
MLQLLYISTARAPITTAMCDDILAVSRRNNPAAAITGLLVAGQRRFLQALEGPEPAVRATYHRIAADPRHFGCVILSQRTVDRRGFGDWAMGYVPGGAEGAPSEDLPTIVASLVATIDDPSLRAQFAGFAEIQSNAA